MKIALFFSLFGLLSLTFSAPTQKPDESSYGKAKTYLLKYGYLTQATKDDQHAYQQALIRLQEQGDIPKTGILDKDTEELMQMPRCDFDNPSFAEYRVVGSWRKKALTYNLRDTTTDMTLDQQKEEIRRAFKVWSDVSDLSFRETPNGRGDIEIRFAKRYHGDGDAFDGPGGTLAHAYFPFAGGDCHLDDDEPFTFNTSRGINLFQVIAHELGHSLGLDHSSDRNALMAAFYRGYQPNFRLTSDDIDGIQSIYGAANRVPVPQPNTVAPNFPDFPTKTTRPTFYPQPQPTRNPNNPNNGDYCQDSQLDDIFSLVDGRTYGFKGDSYVRFTDSGVESTYPRLIRDYWPGLPDNIDAAFDIETGPSGQEEIWFFKGSRLYYYGTNGQAIRGSRPISQAIRGLPDNIDTIFQWTGNDKIYATKGSQYYRILPSLDQIDSGYPRDMNVWTQSSDYPIQQVINAGIDAALHYKNGRTYFFRGQNYYRLSDNPLTFDSDYPRRISYWWFGCTN